jgi:hypothetical protein
MPEKIVITYGNGEPKKGSVRMKPTAAEPSTISLMSLGDYYIARTILDRLGIADTDSVKVTFEKA